MTYWNWIMDSAIVPALGWTVLHSIWQVFLLGIIAFAGLKTISIQKAGRRYIFAYFMLVLIGGLFIWNFNYYYQIAVNQKMTIQVDTGLNVDSETIAADHTLAPKVAEDVLSDQYSTDDINPKAGHFNLSDWFLSLKPLLTKSLPWLVLVWFIGVFILGFRLISSWCYLNYWAKQKSTPVNSFWQRKLEQLKSQLGINYPIRFLESAMISGPLTFGFFKPVIMIPLGMLSQLPPEQVEAVLLHELAHIRRFDFIANILQSLIEILLFFHPVVWWLSRQIRESREDCCDDMAAYYCVSRHHYATSLLQVQKFSFNHKNQLAMNVSGKTGRLTARIQRLLLSPKSENGFARKGLSPLMGLLLILGFLSLYAFTDVFSIGNKTVSISADKMNVFYAGVNNPVTVAVAGIPSEKVRLSSNDVSLEANGDGHYNVKATKPGKAIISVSGEGLETTELEFRVKKLPDPIAVLDMQGNKSSGGNATLEGFQSAKGVDLDFGNFDFEVDMEVVSYQMTWVAKRGDPVSIINSQAAFNEKIRNLIEKTQSGDVYYFDNVTVRSKEHAGQDDEVSWKINSMVFKIK